MYLTYADYVLLGGELTATEYADYGYRAQDALDAQTMGRLKHAAPIPDKVKRALKRFTDIEHKKDTEPQLTSCSNEGVSQSFAVKSYDEQIDDIISTLSDVIVNGVPLLYRGVI